MRYESVSEEQAPHAFCMFRCRKSVEVASNVLCD